MGGNVTFVNKILLIMFQEGVWKLLENVHDILFDTFRSRFKTIDTVFPLQKPQISTFTLFQQTDNRM